MTGDGILSLRIAELDDAIDLLTNEAGRQNLGAGVCISLLAARRSGLRSALATMEDLPAAALRAAAQPGPIEVLFLDAAGALHETPQAGNDLAVGFKAAARHDAPPAATAQDVPHRAELAAPLPATATEPPDPGQQAREPATHAPPQPEPRPADQVPPPASKIPPPPPERVRQEGPGAQTLTRERADLLRELWPNLSLSLREILHRFNGLPGRTLETPNALYSIAPKLGLPTRRMPLRKAAKTPQPTPGEPEPSEKAWTPERVALLTRLHAEHKTFRAIAQACSDLPGPPIDDRMVTRKVHRSGLVRPPKHADPKDPLASLDADDLEEARRMIRSGKRGAKDLAQHFGWEDDRAIAIAAAIRDELVRPEIAA
jgi:hypothetical protein